MGCVNSIARSVSSMNIPTEFPTSDSKCIKIGQLLVSLVKCEKKMHDIRNSKVIKFGDVWEMIGTVVDISNTIT